MTVERILAALARESSDGIVVIDASGSVVWANPRSRSLVRAVADALVADRRITQTERELTRDDGTLVHVDVTWRTLEEDESLAVAIIRDVSDRVALTRALAASREESRHAMALVAAVAHELATPLSVLEMAHDQHTPFDRAQTSARAAMRQMRHLLSDLRRASEGGATALSTVSVRDALASAEQLAAPAIEHANARVTREVAEDCTVMGESGRLVQLLSNLLTNAAHAVSGRQDRVVAVRAVTRAPWVSIEVADSGTGIAREDLERVFDPYFTTKARSQGTGLGLSICRSIAHGLGGRIDVESELGVGTRFELTLRSPT